MVEGAETAASLAGLIPEQVFRFDTKPPECGLKDPAVVTGRLLRALEVGGITPTPFKVYLRPLFAAEGNGPVELDLEITSMHQADKADVWRWYFTGQLDPAQCLRERGGYFGTLQRLRHFDGYLDAVDNSGWLKPS